MKTKLLLILFTTLFMSASIFCLAPVQMNHPQSNVITDDEYNEDDNADTEDSEAEEPSDDEMEESDEETTD